MRQNNLLIPGLVLFVFFLSGPKAFADQLIDENGIRPKMSLNGKWRCAALDDMDAAKPEYDDSKWTQVELPAAFKDGGITVPGVVWCRVTFTAPADWTPKLLSFHRLMDEGQVWLNGSILTFPGLSENLRDRQFGAFYKYDIVDAKPFYVHLWSMNWPLSFPVAAALKPGANTLAVRILDDPVKSFWVYSTTLDDTFKGISGIVGDVTLIGEPNIAVTAFTRTPPLTVDKNAKAPHLFKISIKNSSDKSASLQLSFFIKDGGGKQVFADKKTLKLDPGKESAQEITWAAQPMVELYTAEALLSDSSGSKDLRALKFPGTVVEIRGGKLYLNGEQFIVKCANGLGHYLTDNVEAAREAYRKLQGMGVNTVRGDPPQLEEISIAREFGIMVIPLLGASCRTWESLFSSPSDPNAALETQVQVLAYRDFPNVLMWNSANEVDSEKPGLIQFLTTLHDSIAALDPMKRPVTYSNLGDQTITAAQEVVSWNLYTPGLYNEVLDSLPKDKPALVTEWGRFSDPIDPLFTAQSLFRTWKREIMGRGMLGACYYPGLEDYAFRHPGLNRSQMQFAIAEIYRDFDIFISRKSANQIVLAIYNRMPYKLNDMHLKILDENGKSFDINAGAIQPNSTSEVPIKWIAPRFRVTFDWTTHGGLQRIWIQDIDTENLDQMSLTGRIYMTPDPVAVHTGGSKTILIHVTNMFNSAASGKITLKLPKEIKADPAERTFKLKPREEVNLSFTLKAPATFLECKKNFEVTVKFSSPASPPVIIYSALDVIPAP